MAFVGRLVAVLLGVLAVAGPTASLSSSQTLAPAFDQGIARTPDGWIVSGTDVLARLDEHLQPVKQVDNAIPAAWAKRGYNHIGDIDVSGSTLYVPFEQPNYEDGHQVMARFNAGTLAFRDAKIVNQHENSFVTVDRTSGIAYSMDRFGGDSLLRYDTRAAWRRLTPLFLDTTLEKVQGAAIGRNAVWLMTDDDHHGIYRVDIDSGAVVDVGSATPADGEGEGIDAATTSAGALHVTVTDANHAAVTLDHLAMSGEPSATPAATPTSSTPDTSWPPALIYFGIALFVVGLAAVGTMFRRARTTLHPKSRPPTSD
jgi:hypothetical protein